MEMQTQDSGELSNVVTRLRRRVWRDWLVGAAIALGVALNYAAVNSAAKAAMATPPSAAEMSASADQDGQESLDGGLLVANRHGAGQGLAGPQ
jgi:hypothetical protein